MFGKVPAEIERRHSGSSDDIPPLDSLPLRPYPPNIMEDKRFSPVRPYVEHDMPRKADQRQKGDPLTLQKLFFLLVRKPFKREEPPALRLRARVARQPDAEWKQRIASGEFKGIEVAAA